MGFFQRLFGGRGYSYKDLDRELVVPREEVERCDTERIQIFIGIACNVMKETKHFHLWRVTVHGYEDDPRILVYIPEVRKWCRAAHEAYGPMLPAFLDTQSLQWYLAGVFEPHIIGTQSGNYLYRFESADIAEFAKSVILRTTVLCGMYKVAPDEMRRVRQDAVLRLHQTTGVTREILLAE
jgi:hypothetical protein